ncbi:G2 M phase-specific E3 ubiquitin- ligase [Paramuricea clavata]|uniref:G2 M phase-specific E3 ubiquitin- ligase n=1 Tax=Paramuricea clavata TaxID=317549 RepID=A0A7D9HZP7_PARCT|nr:G2 M phase-specific E3 ubiquitin- ligase [Paramuricea clavata]
MTGKTTINCSFCQKEHTSASCFVVTDIEARKQILRKQGRCFLCLKRNHIARDCESRYMCKYCSGKHHVSLCNNNSRQSLATNSRQSLATRQESNSRQQLGNVQDSLAKEQTTQSRDTKDTGNTKETRNYHACLQDSVLLQTAKAKVGVGNKKLTTEVRVIFDSGSQRSYLTQRVRNKLQLPTGSTESLRIKTFGECETELTASCETVNLAVGDITGRTRTQVEAFVVPVICAPLGNQEIDRAQVEYKHLSDLNLADNNEGDGVAEIDLLIGADQIGKFFTGKIRRGENANSPIASETILGWVLSGPMPSRKKTTLSSVNFVSTHVLRVAAELPRGGESTDDAYIMYRQMKSCFAAGNFNLRKWATNSPVLMAQIQNDEEVLKSLTTEHLNNTGESSYAKESIGGLEEIETPKEHKVLGMNWDTDSDTFVLKLTKVVQFARNLEPSKRNVLKIAAKLFDPLGLLSPVTVLLRMLLQELCAAKYEWDAVISESNQKVLEKWIDDLETGNTTVVNVTNVSETHPPETVGSTKISEIIDHKSYSSVTKLFRVTAWVKRFIRNLKTKKACGKIDPLLKPKIKEERKNEDSKESKQDADIQNEEKPTRQRRIAAINADLKRQSMIDQL